MGKGELGPSVDRQVLVDLIDKFSLGVTLARWEAPPDPESFRFIWVNEEAMRISGGGQGGKPYHEWLGKTLGEAFPELLETPLPQMYATAASESRVLELGDLKIEAKGEPTASFHIRVKGLRPDLIAVVYTNNTALQLAEEHRLAVLGELERSNEELDKFAYIASHDLKAPLRDVDNLSKWIEDDLGEDLPASVKENVRLLRGRVQRMEALLEDLLEYSRAGRVWARTQRFPLDSVLNEVVALAPIGGAFEIDVRIPSGIILETPKVPLELVLRNILSNVFKHHDRERGLVRIECREEGEFIEIQVQDDGPGIPESLHEEAFRMFRTLQPRDRVEGTGMGLALVKKLVLAHGGTVRLDSPGNERGTSVTIAWPRHWRAPAESTSR